MTPDIQPGLTCSQKPDAKVYSPESDHDRTLSDHTHKEADGAFVACNGDLDTQLRARWEGRNWEYRFPERNDWVSPEDADRLQRLRGLWRDFAARERVIAKRRERRRIGYSPRAREVRQATLGGAGA